MGRKNGLVKSRWTHLVGRRSGRPPDHLVPGLCPLAISPFTWPFRVTGKDPSSSVIDLGSGRPTDSVLGIHQWSVQHVSDPHKDEDVLTDGDGRRRRDREEEPRLVGGWN